MERLLFIYNQYSGKGRIKDSLSDVIDTFVKENYEVTVYATQAQGDATRKVIEDGADFDRIVCSGGDGTLDEVITGVMKMGKRVPVGYLPAGSTNDFGNSLGIDKVIDDAAQIAAKGNLFPCDVGKFGDDFFVYVAAFGIFTETSYSTSQKLKNTLGYAAYFLEGIKQLNNVPKYHVKIDTGKEVIEDDFIFGMVTNSMSVGGMTEIVKGEVGLSDGLFEGCFVQSPKNMIELNETLAFLSGLKKKESPHVYNFQSSSFKIECDDEMPWTLDGEFGGNHGNIEIECCHEAIDILVE
ncbi:MAG: YegS/Rv2252/BmrU family lipid kinase [Lachnospiraceae bacterium]|nr:YegS/Rv2252/BmrU family lipid kinase [Lachnospiraceae bacterium]